MILLDGTPSLGQLIMPALTLAINLSFFSITQAQSEQQEKFQQRRKKSPTIMGWIYIDNTRLCNLGLKSPLCWKQLDHTKGRHTETILTEN